MTEFQFYTKLSKLSDEKKLEVSDFIDFLIQKSEKNIEIPKRSGWGIAKGLITIKDDFDDPIPGFEPYMK